MQFMSKDKSDKISKPKMKKSQAQIQYKTKARAYTQHIFPLNLQKSQIITVPE